jgi:hypothetical protein
MAKKPLSTQEIDGKINDKPVRKVGRPPKQPKEYGHPALPQSCGNINDGKL